MRQVIVLRTIGAPTWWLLARRRVNPGSEPPPEMDGQAEGHHVRALQMGMQHHCGHLHFKNLSLAPDAGGLVPE